jgi:nitroimidazol reductase NimA-like FMN-containing flavoprotein (pyridoxamine 5'-phosphate oxidase superfamily)
MGETAMAKYHMNKQEREIHDSAEMRRILQQGKYAVLSLCRANEPYIVTLSYGYDQSNNALYFHTSLKGLKLEFIMANSSVCGTVVEDRGYLKNECAHAYRSVVFWGTISIVKDLEEKKRGLDVLLSHLEECPDPIRKRNFPSDESYRNVCVLRLDIREISGKGGH